MKFRYARHTNNLKSITEFYTKVIGLKILGSFVDHEDYNGVMLGLPDLHWHMEFTESNEKANHLPDDDDLIVFYLNTQADLDRVLKQAQQFRVPKVTSKNPYWNTNGIELKDPDGFGIILTLEIN